MNTTAPTLDRMRRIAAVAMLLVATALLSGCPVAAA